MSKTADVRKAVRLPPETKSRMDRLIADSGLTASTIIRICLDQHLPTLMAQFGRKAKVSTK